MTVAAVLLEVDDLHVTFPSQEGTVRAVNGVSFALHGNDVLGIIGESGCGKSVTALSILGILPPLARITRGSIRYHAAGGTVTITDEARERDHARSVCLAQRARDRGARAPGPTAGAANSFFDDAPMPAGTGRSPVVHQRPL